MGREDEKHRLDETFYFSFNLNAAKDEQERRSREREAIIRDLSSQASFKVLLTCKPVQVTNNPQQGYPFLSQEKFNAYRYTFKAFASSAESVGARRLF